MSVAGELPFFSMPQPALRTRAETEPIPGGDVRHLCPVSARSWPKMAHIFICYNDSRLYMLLYLKFVPLWGHIDFYKCFCYEEC